MTEREQAWLIGILIFTFCGGAQGLAAVLWFLTELVIDWWQSRRRKSSEDLKEATRKQWENVIKLYCRKFK